MRPLPPEAITAASLIIAALIGGIFGVPWLQRRQNRRASEVSTLQATDQVVFGRVEWMAKEITNLTVAVAEVKTELQAERVLRARLLGYVREIVRWGLKYQTPTDPMPAAPIELTGYLED